ncbi:MAG: BlaI/MecI/CopY family transcriptional regulator [Maricaulaceae bacterium]|jgi:predicted transcriptional regulator
MNSQISDAESQIMRALWAGAPLTAEEIIAAVGPANDWAPGTVRTLITRLLRKKAIAGGREDGAYRYRPLIAQADYLQAESQGLLDRLFDGELAPFLANFAAHRALTAKDLREIKTLIAELENKKDGDDDA